MSGQILVVTCEGDAHVDVMVAILKRRGHEPVVVYPDRLFDGGGLTVRMDGEHWASTVSLGPGQKQLMLDSVRSVWWRKPRPVTPPDTVPAMQRDFAQRESNRALNGMWRLLASDPGVYWMSDPARIEEAANKIEQLQRAANAGFRVPRTMVTNEPDQARSFYDSCDRKVIYKPMTGQILGRQYEGLPVEGAEPGRAPVLLTAVVDEEQSTTLDTVRVSPCLFQEHIPKARELRVTVFEDQVFTCALHSQDDERSLVDWRHENADFQYSAEDLPEDLEEKCVQFTRDYGLNFGSFDFIVTPGREYVFLEMNPNGQWMFAQARVPELKMTDALADILIRNAG